MRSRPWLPIALALAFGFATVGLVGGCEVGSCTRHSDCPAHLICGEDGLCITPPLPPDGGVGDGGEDTSDGGTLDASSSD